jgi:hypothetical protein
MNIIKNIIYLSCLLFTTIYTVDASTINMANSISTTQSLFFNKSMLVYKTLRIPFVVLNDFLLNIYKGRLNALYAFGISTILFSLISSPFIVKFVFGIAEKLPQFPFIILCLLAYLTYFVINGAPFIPPIKDFFNVKEDSPFYGISKLILLLGIADLYSLRIIDMKSILITKDITDMSYLTLLDISYSKIISFFLLIVFIVTVINFIDQLIIPRKTNFIADGCTQVSLLLTSLYVFLLAQSVSPFILTVLSNNLISWSGFYLFCTFLYIILFSFRNTIGNSIFGIDNNITKIIPFGFVFLVSILAYLGNSPINSFILGMILFLMDIYTYNNLYFVFILSILVLRKFDPIILNPIQMEELVNLSSIYNQFNSLYNKIPFFNEIRPFLEKILNFLPIQSHFNRNDLIVLQNIQDRDFREYFIESVKIIEKIKGVKNKNSLEE